MTANYNMKNFAGFDDYYKSFDYGIGQEIKNYSKLNPDEYYYNIGVLNYYIGAPRVLHRQLNFIPDLHKNKIKNDLGKK